MIVTVMPNPSLDRTITVGRLAIGGVNRALDSQLDPGGKGVDVSRALHRHGCDTLAVLPLGGAEGRRPPAAARGRRGSASGGADPGDNAYQCGRG